MTNNNLPDELDLAALREAYHSWPTDGPLSLARTVPAASRNHRRHWLVASGAAAAAIVIIGVGAPMINQNGHREASPNAEPPGAAKETPGTTRTSATPLSETPTSAIVQERLDALADQLRVTATTDSGYGYNLVAIDIASYSVTLWRATPNPATDQALRSLADAQRITLHLRPAKFSREHLIGFAGQLRAQNDRWRAEGFTVIGGSPRPDGTLIRIKGDLAAARQWLANLPEVIDISIDQAVPLPEKVPTR